MDLLKRGDGSSESQKALKLENVCTAGYHSGKEVEKNWDVG